MGGIRVLSDRTELARKMPHGAVVAEIGVRTGEFSNIILAFSRPRELHLIDPWASQDESVNPEAKNKSVYSEEKQQENYSGVMNRFSREIAKGRVVVHRGYSNEVLKLFPDSYFDWVYIDGNHSYEACREDLELSVKKVRRGGLIAGHDYVAGNPGDGVKFGVIEAVEGFCADRGWEIICFADELYEGNNFKSYVLAEKGSRGHDFREPFATVARRTIKKLLGR